MEKMKVVAVPDLDRSLADGERKVARTEPSFGDADGGRRSPRGRRQGGEGVEEADAAEVVPVPFPSPTLRSYTAAPVLPAIASPNLRRSHSPLPFYPARHFARSDDLDEQMGFESMQALDNREHHMRAIGLRRLYRRA